MAKKANKEVKKYTKKMVGPKAQGRVVRNRPQTVPPMVASIARMLRDPCGSDLIRGFHGTAEGYLNRFTSSFSVNGGATSLAGFLLWCPDFVSLGGALSGTRQSVFTWASISSATVVPNSVANPFGSQIAAGAPFATAACITSPDYAFLLSQAEKYRTLVSCVQMKYTGKTQDASGEMCFVNDLNANDLLSGTCSVDSIFNRSALTDRLDVAVYENRDRPTGVSSLFRVIGDGNVLLGSAGVAASIVPISPVSEPKFFGIAWRNISNGNNLNFKLTTADEWVPIINTGVAVPPMISSGPLSGGSYLEAAKATLDQVSPGWQQSATRGLAAAFSNLAMAGAGRLIRPRRIAQMVGN